MEKNKAKIELIKTLFLVFVTALFSSIGYLFTNLNTLENIRFFILIYVIIFSAVIDIFLIFLWIKEISRIKD